ncbi:MAG: TMEM175 family protein [Pseudolabrys sp.]
MAQALTIPKHRLDGLTDAVFGVAMTLLVLDLKLPETADFKSPGEFLHALSELDTQFLTYVISFFVLGLHWLGYTQLSARTKDPSFAFARSALIYLLFITLIPFSTMLVGRFGDFALASWVYAANMIGGSLVSLHLIWLAAKPDNTAETREDRLGSFLLIASALLSVAISLVSPGHAMLGYLLNTAHPILTKWFMRPPS